MLLQLLPRHQNSTMLRKRLLYISFLILLFSSCRQSHYDSEEFRELLLVPGTSIIDTAIFKNSIIYRVYQDKGFADVTYYIFHKNGSNNYHRLKEDSKYTRGQIWRSHILQTCDYIGQPVDTGVWVKKELYTRYGHGAIRFTYDKKLDSLKPLETAGKPEGVYKLTNGELVFYGPLTNFCSFHDLDSGSYFLTPPGIFYKEKIEIETLESQFD
jgi:hypothetical protein